MNLPTAIPAGPGLAVLPINSLDPHPDNPRLSLRDDVVERVTAEIDRSGFGAQHAILVRPLGERWQIVSGHHRVEAARRVGLAELPAWVAELDDDEAFMQLVLSNTQGELSPLEIGMHALRAVPPGKGGRGITGGLSEYARRIGRSKSAVSMLRSAAEVAETVQSSERFPLTENATHLYEVSRTPRPCWSALVAALGKHGWTVEQTAAHAGTANKLAEAIPTEHAAWLPLPTVVDRYLAAPERFTPRAVKRLVDTADEVLTLISQRGEGDDRHDFLTFLCQGVFDGRRILDYRALLLQTITQREADRQQKEAVEAFTVPGWYHGPWQDHISELEDGSVALVLTDPPYGVSYQSDYRVDRAVDHRHEVLHGDNAAAIGETRKALEALHPKMDADCHILVFCTWRTDPATREMLEHAGFTVRGSLIWVKNQTGMGDPATTFAPKHERIVHAVKGSPKMLHRVADVLEAARCPTDRHPTEKPVELLTQLIEATTSKGQLIADPFAGVASTCVAAKDVARRWWGCEIEESYWAIGEERLS